MKLLRRRIHQQILSALGIGFVRVPLEKLFYSRPYRQSSSPKLACSQHMPSRRVSGATHPRLSISYATGATGTSAALPILINLANAKVGCALRSRSHGLSVAKYFAAYI
jgi:hypothetical protein